MSGSIKNIFVSHYHQDADMIEKLKKLIGEHGVEMRDSSIYEKKLKNDAHNENYIKYELIKPQITWAGTVVVLIGPETAHSDYVNWEINAAADLGKNIVGIFLPGASDCDIPNALKEYGTNLVTWNGKKIVDAIDGKNVEWENADGSKRQSGYNIRSHT